jgi:hypothetical protein
VPVDDPWANFSAVPLFQKFYSGDFMGMSGRCLIGRDRTQNPRQYPPSVLRAFDHHAQLLFRRCGVTCVYLLRGRRMPFLTVIYTLRTL